MCVCRRRKVGIKNTGHDGVSHPADADLRGTALQMSCSLQTGNILQDFPAVFLLGLLRLHPQGVSVCAHFVLKTRDDANWESVLLGPQAIGGADHLCAFHRLRVPVVPVEAAFEVGITLGLKKVIIVPFLVKVVHVVVLAVVANLLHHDADGSLVFADQFHVLRLLMFENFDQTLFFGECTLEL